MKSQLIDGRKHHLLWVMSRIKRFQYEKQYGTTYLNVELPKPHRISDLSICRKVDMILRQRRKIAMGTTFTTGTELQSLTQNQPPEENPKEDIW